MAEMTAEMGEKMEIARPLPVGSVGRSASGWWGMWCLIGTEAALFAYLLFSYFYLAAQSHGGWVPELPKLKLALPNTLLLILSSFVLQWAEKGIERGKSGRLAAGVGLTLLMGAAFVAVQAMEWRAKPFHLSDNAYASIYYVTTGFHMLHVVAGLLALAVVFVAALSGSFDGPRHSPVTITAMYWHFVDIVWLCVFTTFYLTPYLHLT